MVEVKDMDSIKEEFKGKAIIRGKTHRYNPADALEVVKRCKELNKKIWGIDAFIIGEHWTQPVLEHSVDFTSRFTPKGMDDGYWLDALKFIQERMDRGFVFEIVYEK